MRKRVRRLAPYNPSKEKQEQIGLVQEVLEEYRNLLPLTLRQVFYRLVGVHNYEKTEAAYARLGETLNRARRSGIIPFVNIRDDGVQTDAPFNFTGLDDATEYLIRIAKTYTLDRQQGQSKSLMLICEAAGMVPQLAKACHPYGVTVQSSGGFSSVTAKHDLAQTICQQGPTEIFHIGDHDPSGVHLFQNLSEDVSKIVSDLDGIDSPKFTRLAVTPEQIQEFSLPTAPAKKTDRRSFAGVGDDASATVQAEAIPPDALAQIVRQAINNRMDLKLYEDVLNNEDEQRQLLTMRISQIV